MERIINTGLVLGLSLASLAALAAGTPAAGSRTGSIAVQLEGAYPGLAQVSVGFHEGFTYDHLTTGPTTFQGVGRDFPVARGAPVQWDCIVDSDHADPGGRQLVITWKDAAAGTLGEVQGWDPPVRGGAVTVAVVKDHRLTYTLAPATGPLKVAAGCAPDQMIK